MGQGHGHAAFPCPCCSLPSSPAGPLPCWEAARRRMLPPFPKSPFYAPKAAVSPPGRAEQEAQRRPPLSRPPPAQQLFPLHRARAAAAGAKFWGFTSPHSGYDEDKRVSGGVRGPVCPPGSPSPLTSPSSGTVEFCAPQAEGLEAQARRREARLPFFFRKR